VTAASASSALAGLGQRGEDSSIVIEARRTLRIVALLLTAGSIVACSTGGNAPSAPPSVAAAASPSVPVSTPAASVAGSPSASIAPSNPTATELPAMNLTSRAFADGTDIPRKYSCDGGDVSPPLAWAGVPADAQALVLIVDDPDARGFVHWVAFDIPPTPAELPEGASTSDSSLHEGTNTFGKHGYGGPCPPSGTHHYRFRLFAVRAPLGLSGAPTAEKVLAATEGQVIADTTLTGLYHR
jgi:Raf kinase inhibitor-like YbhB/YbcL family protein